MFRVAQGARVLAKARKGGAGGRGAQREALTQHPGEWRIEAKNLIQQSETGTGAESRVAAGSGADNASCRRRAQDGNSCSNNGLVGAKLGAASRRDRRCGKATGASPCGSAAGVSSSNGSAASTRTMVLA